MSDLSAKFTSFWEKEEASGTRIDAPGTNDLTDNNGVTQAAGKVGNAAQFTAASSQYLSIADNASLSCADIDFSWCGWVYLDTKVSNQWLVSKWDYINAKREYGVFYDSAADRLKFVISPDSTASTTVTADNLGAVSTATWYFWVAWHDAAGDTINIQVDDGTANSAAHSTGCNDNSSPLLIGALEPLDGFIDGRSDQLGFAKALFTTDEKTFLSGGRSWSDIVIGPGTTKFSWWAWNQFGEAHV